VRIIDNSLKLFLWLILFTFVYINIHAATKTPTPTATKTPVYYTVSFACTTDLTAKYCRPKINSKIEAFLAWYTITYSADKKTVYVNAGIEGSKYATVKAVATQYPEIKITAIIPKPTPTVTPVFERTP